jgi:APA family basic amino acid/polyamine antiporter
MIGAGIFTTTGYLMNMLGNPVVMLALWLTGGLTAFCGALAFSELGAAFPEAGGEYTFISRLIHPLPGFLSGWLSLIVGFSAPIAASAIGFSRYFLHAFPVFQSWLPEGGISDETFSRLLAVMIIFIFSLLHSRGVVPGSRIQNGLTLIKILLLAGLVSAGFLLGKGDYDSFFTGGGIDMNFKGFKSAGLALMFIMFSYSGWNAATYIGSEIKEPRKVIPRSLLVSTGIVTLLYLMINLFFVYAIPPGQMAGEPEIGALAAGNAFGGAAGKVISLLISFALFSSLSAFIILGPRVYYSMSGDGLFFKFASIVHPKYKVPRLALALQGVIAVIMVLTGTFEQILAYMGFALGIFPLIAVAGVFILRIRGRSKLKMPGYPAAHIFFIVVSLAILVLAFMERPPESSVAIITALSGIPVYYWFKSSNKN